DDLVCFVRCAALRPPHRLPRRCGARPWSAHARHRCDRGHALVLDAVRGPRLRRHRRDRPRPTARTAALGSRAILLRRRKLYLPHTESGLWEYLTMFDRIFAGYQAASDCWAILRQDKKLLLFPLISGICCIL